MKPLKSLIVIFMLVLFAVPALAGRQVFIPHLTDGDSQWGDFLTIDNTSPDPADVVITLYDIDGSQVYKGKHSVGSMGETLIDVRQLSDGAGSGMIEIPDGGHIHCRLSLLSLTGGGVAEFKLDDSQGSILTFLFSDFLGDATWKGVAVTNYGNVAGEITFFAYGNGELLGTSETLDIEAHEKIVGLANTWFPGIDSNSIKKIVAVSSVDTLGGVAIAGDASLARLLFTSAVNLEQFSFSGVVPEPVIPEKGISGTWKGMWHSIQGDSGVMVVRMTRQGDKIVGSGDYYNTVCGNVSNVVISGNISGNRLEITSSYWCGQYLAKLTASGTLNGDSINGYYDIQSVAAGYHDSGTLNLTRSK